MTPSPEARAIAADIQLQQALRSDYLPTEHLTTTIDNRLTPYRQQVAALVEAAREAMSALMYEDDAFDGINSVTASEKLRAALAPFTETAP